MIPFFPRLFTAHSFQKVDSSFYTRYGPELVDIWGNSHKDNILLFLGKRWMVKQSKFPEQQQRDFLAWELGKGWLNIPEMYKPSFWDLPAINAIFAGNMGKRNKSIYLVRLAQDYHLGELSVQDLTKAVAGELVFSVWIRRRDAHFSNRSLIDGVPMFFDFEVAFQGSPISTDAFFQPGPDVGYAGNWRLCIVSKGSPVLLREMRERESRKPLSLHPIWSVDEFWDHVRSYRDLIKDTRRDRWWEAIRRAGFHGTRVREVFSFLEESAGNLGESLEVMQRIVQPVTV